MAPSSEGPGPNFHHFTGHIQHARPLHRLMDRTHRHRECLATRRELAGPCDEQRISSKMGSPYPTTCTVHMCLYVGVLWGRWFDGYRASVVVLRGSGSAQQPACRLLLIDRTGDDQLRRTERPQATTTPPAATAAAAESSHIRS